MEAVGIILAGLTAALLGYQVSMPSVDNAKYTFTVHNGQIVRMNTQNGEFDRCNEHLVCSPVKPPNNTESTTEPK